MPRNYNTTSCKLWILFLANNFLVEISCHWTKVIFPFRLDTLPIMCLLTFILLDRTLSKLAFRHTFWIAMFVNNNQRLIFRWYFIKQLSAIFRPLEWLDSIRFKSPQNDVLSLDGVHIGEPITSHQSENVSWSLDLPQWRDRDDWITNVRAILQQNWTSFCGWFEWVPLESSLSNGRRNTALISKEWTEIPDWQTLKTFVYTKMAKVIYLLHLFAKIKFCFVNFSKSQ
jgi:hypothetical protein